MHNAVIEAGRVRTKAVSPGEKGPASPASTSRRIPPLCTISTPTTPITSRIGICSEKRLQLRNRDEKLENVAQASLDPRMNKQRLTIDKLRNEVADWNCRSLILTKETSANTEHLNSSI